MPGIDRRMVVTGSAVTDADPAHTSNSQLAGLEAVQYRDALLPTQEPHGDHINAGRSLDRRFEKVAPIIPFEKAEGR